MDKPATSLGALLRSDMDPPDSVEGRRAAKNAILRFFKAVAAGDMASLAESVTNDVIYELPFSETGSTEPGSFRQHVGREAVVAFWQATTSSGIQSAAPEDVEFSLTADGSRAFLEQRGNLTMPDGKRYRNRYVFRFDITGGRVSHVKEYFNPIISAYAFGRPIAGDTLVRSP